MNRGMRDDEAGDAESGRDDGAGEVGGRDIGFGDGDRTDATGEGLAGEGDRTEGEAVRAADDARAAVGERIVADEERGVRLRPRSRSAVIGAAGSGDAGAGARW